MELRERRPRTARRVVLGKSPSSLSLHPSGYLHREVFPPVGTAFVSDGMWFCGSWPIGSPCWIPLSLALQMTRPVTISI